MQTPYTASPLEAFEIVQGCTGVALTALVWFRTLRPRLGAWLFTAAIWLVAALPESLDFFRGVGWTFEPTVLGTVLKASAALAALGVLVARPHWVGGVGVLGALASWWLVKNVAESDSELCALHLAWFGALLGFQVLADSRPLPSRPVPSAPEPTYLRQDLALAVLATFLGGFVATEVLLRSCDSADEWAYTYQAALFAKLHAYGQTPRCTDAFRAFWVFDNAGRTFAQYTPGWPLFMTPFVRLDAAWLAAPVSLGLLVAGVARVARRAARGASGGSSRRVEAAGIIAAFATMTASAVLINGGSRFGHVFICACFAWSVEALAVLTTPPVSRRAQWGWGTLLGTVAAWMLATRPSDAGMLGVGLTLYFLYAAATRRVPWRGFVGAAASFAVFAGFTLVILRLQLGKWFTTGYSLAASYYPWADVDLSKPSLSEIRWGVPIATGSYCWWPLCPSLGLVGLVSALRGPGRRVGFMLATGVTCLLVFYSFVTFGRGTDFGYGPRYSLPAIVPMAVGTGVALAPLWVAARGHVLVSRAFSAGGPIVVAVAALVAGVIRLAPLIYPFNHADVEVRNAVFTAARAANLENAIVWIGWRTTVPDVLDQVQNYPLDLYPAPSVLYAIDRGPAARACVQELYPHRTQYHTRGPNPLSLVRE